MGSIRKVIHEIHRRSLWQVLGIYLVGSWIGYQVILNLTQGIGLPPWVPGFAFVLFVIGLPVVLATAFVQEGAPTPAVGADATTAESPSPTAVAAPPSPGAPPRAAAAQHASASSSAAPAARHPLTWRRALVAGAAAFLLLGLTAGGYMGVRAAGIGPFGALIAAGKLEAREPLLLADFGAPPGDRELADALTQAFRIDLAESPVVRLVEPSHVRDLLQRMGREDADRLDAALAREAARRDGIKAVITGEVSRAGRGFVLSASLVAAEDGGMLAAFRENAADSAAVLAAVDRLSRRMRARIGESLRTVHGGAALPAVTTTSLEALQRYAQGEHALSVDLDHERAIALLEEATAIDPEFGMAWRKLAVAYSNAGAGQSVVGPPATRAWELREHMSPRERLHAIAYYHFQVTRDIRTAIQTYRTLLDSYPDDFTALHNVALLYSGENEHDQAIAFYERALEVKANNLPTYTNLVGVFSAVGRLDDAEQLLDRYTERFGETAQGLNRRAVLAVQRGDFDRGLAIATDLRERYRGDPVARVFTENLLNEIHTLRGRLALAAQHRRALAAGLFERGNTGAPLQLALEEVELELSVRGDTAAAITRLDRAVVEHPPDSLPPAVRPYLVIAGWYAMAGRFEAARRWLDAHERNAPFVTGRDERGDRAFAALTFAWGARDFDEALRQLDVLAELPSCRRCIAAYRARALDAASDERALAAWEQYLDTPHGQLGPDPFNLAVAHERLADLYAGRGDVANAARHAARFVEIWSDADPEFQPRVAAKLALLRELQADR